MKDRSASQFAFANHPGAARIRRRKEPVQERSRFTVMAIVEATLQVLLSGGAHSLTTTRVAERAGISVGTLYQYFPDKLSLLTALQVRYVELIVDRVTSAAHATIGCRLEPALRAIIAAALSVKRENLQLTLALREVTHAIESAELLRDAMGRLIVEIERVLEAALPGLHQPQVAARTIATAIEGVIDSVMQVDPASLQDPGIEDELTALGVGYIRQRARMVERRRREG